MQTGKVPATRVIGGWDESPFRVGLGSSSQYSGRPLRAESRLSYFQSGGPLWRKCIVLNVQKSCFLTGYGRVKTKGMVKYPFEVLSRQTHP